jgi:hypothetical protein
MVSGLRVYDHVTPLLMQVAYLRNKGANLNAIDSVTGVYLLEYRDIL